MRRLFRCQNVTCEKLIDYERRKIIEDKNGAKLGYCWDCFQAIMSSNSPRPHRDSVHRDGRRRRGANIPQSEELRSSTGAYFSSDPILVYEATSRMSAVDEVAINPMYYVSADSVTPPEPTEGLRGRVSW